MIPQFPEFKNIEVSDREEVEAYTHRYPPYSDFNFTSLYAWDTNKKRLISELSDNLVVLFTDYATDEEFLSFLGTNEPEHTARTLIDYAKSKAMPEELRLVGEVSIREIRSSVLAAQETRDHFDYLFSVPELARLEGTKYKGRRNFVNRFMREHPMAHAEIVDLTDLGAKHEITSVLKAWEKNKEVQGKQHDSQHEEIAIRRLIESAEAHSLVATAVFDRDTLLAFSIDELLPNQYCIGHFWKGDHAHTGIYDFLIQKKAQHFETLGAALWNYEQDLGVEGLRKSKMDYRPVDFLKKYSVSLA